MPRSGRNLRTVLITAVSLVVAAGLGIPLLQWIHTRRLHALFDGPFETKQETRSGFYGGVVYNPKLYLPEGDNAAGARSTQTSPSALDKPRAQEWERAVEGMHLDWELDAYTKATRVARLRSPTVYKAQWVPRFLTVTYPPENALFPPNLCSPTIEWSDAHNDLWRITLSVPDASLEWNVISSDRTWQVPDDVWAQLTGRAVGLPVYVEVRGVQRSGLWGRLPGKVHRSQRVGFSVSKDPADDAIVYRLVAPPFVNRKTPNIYVRDIRQRRERLLLDAHRSYCFNCHTFSSRKGDQGRLALQVRYLGQEYREPRVYLSMYDIDTGRGRKIVLPFEIQMSTFMAWSPDGTRLALSANQKMAGFYPIVFETQSVGMSSDLGVCDMTDGTARLLPGATAAKVIETYPCWTPDGESIIYSSAEVGKHFTLTRFDLRIIPYNNGEGGVPKDLPGASGNQKSNHFARFSPDGKWLSWVQSAHESLIKASSDIYLMNWETKKHHRLSCNVDYAADSWHSWSSNSRWIAFATKRDDGIYARIYLTHIDVDGNASPAVRLPIPDRMIRMSFNLPEFVEHVPPIRDAQLYAGVGIDAEVRRLELPTVPGREPEGR